MQNLYREGMSQNQPARGSAESGNGKMKMSQFVPLVNHPVHYKRYTFNTTEACKFSFGLQIY